MEQYKQQYAELQKAYISMRDILFRDFIGGFADKMFLGYLGYLIIKYLFIEPDIMYFLLSTIACAAWELSCKVKGDF
jgi:hypothetical protein